MANSILEQISQNILTTLNGMTVAMGYTQDITFTRPLRKGTIPTANTGILAIAAVKSEGQDGDTQQPIYSQLQHFMVDYELEIYIFQSDDDTTPIDTIKSNIFADCSILLMADAQRGSPADASGPHLALDTFVTGYDNFFDEDGSFEGMTVNFSVHYRVFRNNPYQAG